MLMAWCWASSIWSPWEEERGVTRFLSQHTVLHQAEVGEPGFELRRRAQAEELTQFGWLRLERVPGVPMVLAQWAVHGIFLAPYIKSRLDMSLVTAAIISAVRPVEMRWTIAPVVVSASSHSRSWPTVQPLISW